MRRWGQTAALAATLVLMVSGARAQDAGVAEAPAPEPEPVPVPAEVTQPAPEAPTVAEAPNAAGFNFCTSTLEM